MAKKNKKSDSKQKTYSAALQHFRFLKNLMLRDSDAYTNGKIYGEIRGRDNEPKPKKILVQKIRKGGELE